MSIESKKKNIIERFKHFERWEDRYRQLIHYGKKLSPMADHLKNPDILVPGCLSKVWLYHEKRNGKVFFQADSDASITKGIIGILLHVYSGASPEEILQNPADFLGEIGLYEHLSQNRRNGLFNMLRLIESAATHYSTPSRAASTK